MEGNPTPPQETGLRTRMATSTPRRVEELGGTMWLIMANSCRELWLQNRYDRGNPAENSQQVCFVTRFWVIVYRPAATSPLTGVFDDVENNLLPLTPVFTSIKLLMEGLSSTTDSMCLAPSASPIWCFLNSCEHGLILTLSSCTLRIHFFSEAIRNP